MQNKRKMHQGLAKPFNAIWQLSLEIVISIVKPLQAYKK